MFLSNVKISIWTSLFYKKNVSEKEMFFINSKGRYYLLGRTGINFAMFWNI